MQLLTYFVMLLIHVILKYKGSPNPLPTCAMCNQRREVLHTTIIPSIHFCNLNRTLLSECNVDVYFLGLNLCIILRWKILLNCFLRSSIWTKKIATQIWKSHFNERNLIISWKWIFACCQVKYDIFLRLNEFWVWFPHLTKTLTNK